MRSDCPTGETAEDIRERFLKESTREDAKQSVIVSKINSSLI